MFDRDRACTISEPTGLIMFDIISSGANALLICIGTFAFLRMLITEIIPTIKSGFVERRVAKKGIAVEGDIIASHQTSSWGGNKPIYQITIRFKTYDGQEVESAVKQALSFEEIERYKAGNGITLKYDPKNPKNIAVYDKPIILGS